MFAQQLHLINKAERPVQSDYVNALESALTLPNKISLLQAETGVGKSLAFTYAALRLLQRQPGNRIIIASSTIQLLRELLDQAVPDALTLVFGQRNALNVGFLLGVSNYVSGARLRAAMASLPTSHRDRYRQEFDILMAWTDDIDSYLADYAELPAGIAKEQICQTISKKEAWYTEQRKAAVESDVLLVSHAMLINDIQTGGALLACEDEARKTWLIIDEADSFHDQLDARRQTRLHLHDLAGAVSRLPKPFSGLSRDIDRLIDAVKAHCAAGDYFKPVRGDGIAALKKTLSAIERTLRGCGDELAQDCRQQLNELLNGPLPRPGIGFGLSKVLNEPSIVFINPFFTRHFAAYAQRMQAVVLTSGTLSTSHHYDHGLKWILDNFNIGDEAIGIKASFAPERFGDMRFVLAGDAFPPVFAKSPGADQDVVLNPDWLKAAGDYIVRLDGKALVLTHSHAETEALAGHLNSEAVVWHRRGTPLSDAVRCFKTEDKAVLITAGGKAGLNIRAADGGQLIRHVVITRVPFSPPQKSQEADLKHYLMDKTDISNPDQAAQQYFYSRNMTRAVRLLKQALGRGIRDEQDRVTISILDRRFPVFNALTPMKALKAAIPERFMEHYRRARVLAGTEKKAGLW